MKARIDAIIQRNQAEYLEQLIPQADPLLREMEEYGAAHGVPSADREVALWAQDILEDDWGGLETSAKG